jgi:hypothetical protein
VLAWGLTLAVAVLLVFVVPIIGGLQLGHEIEDKVPIGSSISRAQSTMSSIGFVCARDNPKSLSAPIDELFCLKKQKIGPGLSNDNWHFLAVMAPSLYAFIPKGPADSATYQRQEIRFVLKDGVVSSVGATTRLTPQ